jgi:hypothetical protein
MELSINETQRYLRRHRQAHPAAADPRSAGERLMKDVPETTRRTDMKHPILKLALPLLAVIVTGCANMGTGLGSTNSSPNRVNFSLKNSDAISGSMNARLPDDQPSSADFF